MSLAHCLMLPDLRIFLLDWRCAVDSLEREELQSLLTIDRNRNGVCVSRGDGRRHDRTQDASGMVGGGSWAGALPILDPFPRRWRYDDAAMF